MAYDRVTTPLVVILGETASGKSALALKLAEQFNGEIICADSWTVYRGFDIGTAKPTVADRQKIPHHVVDVTTAKVGFNASLFKELALKAIDDISSRGNLPIMVGGSGLYINSVIFDYKFNKPPDKRFRYKLNQLSLAELVTKAEQSGLAIDQIDKKNKRRVIRFIETGGLVEQSDVLRQNTLLLGININQEMLKQRISTRVDQMVSLGFESEVKHLKERYGWDIEAMKAPGYRAFKDYVEGLISLEEAKTQFINADIKLAKKQRTWFKRNPSIQWIEKRSEAVALVTTYLNN